MTQAYTKHLIERLDSSNRAIGDLVAAIETKVGVDTLQEETWEPVLAAILATTPLVGPAMGEARFAMTNPEQS